MIAKGAKEIRKHLKGKELTPTEAILGKCADCMASYVDGMIDCGMPECTLYPFMPYKKNNKKEDKL